MKMETTIAATKDGTVVALNVTPGSTVGAGELLASIE
jgi:biotin carboxyl carrier protein